MKKPVFPSLRDVADSKSAATQKIYLSLNVTQFSLLVLVALSSGFSSTTAHHKQIVSWTICASLFFALMCTTALRIGKFEVQWFKCRAFAENAKSLSWRFVAIERASPHDPEKEFLEEWHQLQLRLYELQHDFAITSPAGRLFTDWMTATRAESLQEKVKIYREQRLDDQISWYATNAGRNARCQSAWFWALFVIEAGCVVVSAFQAETLGSLNAVGLVAAVASAIAAWMQLRRFAELSTSYAIAAEDLTLISEKYKKIPDQATMNSFVEDVEEAISREHSMWLARRNC